MLVIHFCSLFNAPVIVSDVIDLTGDDKDDLQRAIALSLEESNRAFRETGITDEEQAISRWGLNCTFNFYPAEYFVLL